MSNRIRKINELIREEASKAIEENLSRDNLVTVKAVETSRDLKESIIWVSVMGDEKKAMEELATHKSAIQHAITSKMYSKYTPKIEFKIDRSQAYVDRIEELLHDQK
jgi:ribosome-binding factor A